MLCTNCKAAADLRARVARFAEANTMQPDEVGTVNTAEDIAAHDGLAVIGLVILLPYVPDSGFVALEVAGHVHGLCLGGLQGCGCQHRGTPYATTAADRHQALITSPEVSA